MAGRFEGVSDLAWRLFEDIFPPASQKRSRGMPHAPFRQSLNTLLSILLTGCRWCDVPRGPRQTKWQAVTVHDWDGAPQRGVEVVTGTCVWYHTGMPAVPIRWVVIRDPPEQFVTQALLSTQLAATPHQILAWFVRRWQMEGTFEEARAHLGMETQRQWSEKAIARTTPCVLGLYACVSLLAARLLKGQPLPVRREAWYAKPCATCSDTIAFVRRWLWSQQHFQMSNTGSDVIKVPRGLFERLTETLCYAA
jgi:hypothetical protein